DDSACNLSSINLMRFLTEDDRFDLELFRDAVRTMILAMEIIVDASSYPTAPIAQNSHDYRPLGLGYANLGSLLMHYGLPYDSDAGRALAASVSAYLSAEGYHMSAEIAKRVGAFPGFDKNRSPMLRVMGKHLAAAEKIVSSDPRLQPYVSAAIERWRDTVRAGELWGYRNAQISVIAPTGTIGLLMGCDTLGLEPELSLVKTKNLVGGGTMRMVNRTVEDALKMLGYPPESIEKVKQHLTTTGTLEGAPELKPEHLAVFDCALAPAGSVRTISPMGHLQMLGAVQPFLSGGASKTINLSHDATVEDIEKIYMEAWRAGIKSVALYRDGCKASQPYETGKGKAGALPAVRSPVRERLPDERKALTHHFQVGGHDGYVTVGLYPDGRPGEMFFRVTKEGSTVNGLMDSLGISMSMALQHGVPLKDLVRKLAHMRFEPAGATNNPKIRFAKSIPDYVARWLALEFLTENDRRSIGLEGPESSGSNGTTVTEPKRPVPSAATFGTMPLDAFAEGSGSNVASDDAPSCHICGGIMVRSGTCYACTMCGATSGCS
ncbi:MAG: vitamin B12-dependent ribonucleotide reductase, partial [Thermoplasmata archaeon]